MLGLFIFAVIATVIIFSWSARHRRFVIGREVKRMLRDVPDNSPSSQEEAEFRLSEAFGGQINPEYTALLSKATFGPDYSQIVAYLKTKGYSEDDALKFIHFVSANPELFG